MKSQAPFSLKDEKIKLSSAVFFVWRFKDRTSLLGGLVPST